MEQLSQTEMDFILYWKTYMRMHRVESFRPVLVFYLMTEMLIEYKQQLPKDKRPSRPTEDAMFTIGATSGGLCKWRKKWKPIWDIIKKML